MNIESRDKKALTLGVVAVLAIILLGYGVIPAARRWSVTQADLTSDQAYVASLRESVRSQEATLKQRNALVLRMGSLFGPQASPAVAKKEETPAASPATPSTPPSPASGTPEDVKKPVAGDKTVPQAEAPPPSGDAAKPPPPEPDKADAKKSDIKKVEPPKTTPPESGTLAGYVEQNAKKAGATVKRITPKKSATALKDTKRFRAVTLQVSFECTVQNLVDLLKALEKGDRFVKVDLFQLKRDLASGDKLEVTMDLHSYEAEAGSS